MGMNCKHALNESDKTPLFFIKKSTITTLSFIKFTVIMIQCTVKGITMDRDIEKELVYWKGQETRMPILLRGARQVGKSYVVEKFGREHFNNNILIVNFELQPELCACFDSLNPLGIIQKLSILMRRKIEPNKTLLFLDEIQDCPNAIRALRYFKEQLPELHIIGAGSLLEFTL